MKTNQQEKALGMFIQRLQDHSPLTDEQSGAVFQMEGEIVTLAARRDVLHMGADSQFRYLVVEGLLASYAQLNGGSRQIVNLYIPGDLPNLQPLVHSGPDAPLHALAPTTVFKMPLATLLNLALRDQALAVAFWRDCAAEREIVAQRLVNLGRKSALARLAHLFCELAFRYGRISEVTDLSYPLLMTQEQIGDVLGLTAVHVNRSIKALRIAGYIAISGSRLLILNPQELATVAEFDPAYLKFNNDHHATGTALAIDRG